MVKIKIINLSRYKYDMMEYIILNKYNYILKWKKKLLPLKIYLIKIYSLKILQTILKLKLYKLLDILG